MAGELILVVDDDPDIVELLRCVLSDVGYEVAAADADATLSLARAPPPPDPHRSSAARRG